MSCLASACQTPPKQKPEITVVPKSDLNYYTPVTPTDSEKPKMNTLEALGLILVFPLVLAGDLIYSAAESGTTVPVK